VRDRIFLDANILFSAACRPGAGLNRLWELQNVDLVTSAYAVEEARLNLADGAQHERLNKLLERVRVVATVSGGLPARGIKLPEKDLPILATAVQVHATHLLTGDKQHFGKYFGRSVEGVLILPPAEYLKRRMR
jgi:predicted nucleic acid-binding protein